MRWFTFLCILFCISLIQSSLTYWINIGSAVPDLYFSLIIFYSISCGYQAKCHCKLADRVFQGLGFRGAFWDQFRVFCRYRFFRLVLAGVFFTGATSLRTSWLPLSSRSYTTCCMPYTPLHHFTHSVFRPPCGRFLCVHSIRLW